MFRKTYLLILISALLAVGCSGPDDALDVDSPIETSTVDLGEADLPVQATNTPTLPKEEATATVEPTPVPTQTPEPTKEPQPTEATADSTSDSDGADAPDGFAIYEALEGGYRFLYPAEWVAEDFFGLTFLATNPDVMEDSENIDSGAFMMIISVPEEELESSSLIENLGFAADGIHPDPTAGDPVILTEPTELEINGYTAGQVLVEYPHSETGPVTTMITLIKNEGRFVSLMGSTPSAEASDYLPLLEAIVSSVTLMEPIEVELETGDFNVDSTVYDEILTQPISVDAPPVDVVIPENSQIILTFEAEEGMVIDIEVVGKEWIDLVLELTDDSGESLVGIVDEEIDTEEINSYVIPQSGLYNILVSEYDGSSGIFSAEVVEVEVIDLADLPTSGVIEIGEEIDAFLADGEIGIWQFETSTEVALIVIVDPESDFDVVFEVIDESGELITYGEIDEEFSGTAESTVLTIPAAGLYTINVSGFAGDGGRYSISVE